MNYTQAEVIEHSVGPDGQQAITMKVRFPRIVLAEFNTHRKLSKNTASSRAIPFTKLVDFIRQQPFIPEYWGANQKGMQADKPISEFNQKFATFAWKAAIKSAIGVATTLNKLGVHKQLTNRLIESFGYVTVVFTTTDMMNFLTLRNHRDAQPEIQVLANKIHVAFLASTPTMLKHGQWHLPFVLSSEKQFLPLADQLVLSVARCASTSYMTVDGKPMTLQRANEIYYKLIRSDVIHATPFEHQLTPDRKVDIEWRVAKSKKKLKQSTVWETPSKHGNTVGFIQYRKTLANESACADQPLFLDIKES